MKAMRLPVIQTIGSAIVFTLVALSGAAAWALSVAPDTPFFWYLDREIFGVVQFARFGLFPSGQSALWLGLGGVFLALATHWRGSMFGAGLVSHACFVLIAQPAYAWILAAQDVRIASLVAQDVSAQGYFVTWLSVVATIVSIAACHVTYLIGISRRFRGRSH